MFSFQQRVMREACKELRTSDHSEERKKLPEILPEEEQILNLLEKDFKSMLKYAQKYKINHGQKRANHILFPIPSLAICICFIQIIHVAVSASARISLSKPQDDLLFTMFIEQ